MQHKAKARLAVEQLEDRFVPATVRLIGSNLLISNPLITGGKSSLTVTQTASGVFQVQDGAQSLGTYRTSGLISITGNNAAENINVNFAGFTYNGSLSINAGNGNDLVNVIGTGGAILGNVTVIAGNGSDVISLNNNLTSPVVPGSLTVGGATTVVHSPTTATLGDSTVRFGNPAAVSKFLGNVNVTGANLIGIGFTAGGVEQPDVFAGDFNASVGPNQPLNFKQDINATGNTTITLAGSLRINGGYGVPGVQLGAIDIGGDLSVNFSSPSPFPAVSPMNRLDLSTSQSAVGNGITTVSGNTSYSSVGDNLINLSGSILQGNVQATLANGNDSISLDTFNGIAVIGGNFTINKGNGSLNTAPFGSGIQATINGDVNLNLGNGSNSVTFDTGGGVVGGTIHLHTGNGNNQLNLLNAQSYLVDVLFGNGNDTVTLNNAGAILSGRLNGAGGTNRFQQLLGTLSPYLQLQNFNG